LILCTFSLQKIATNPQSFGKLNIVHNSSLFPIIFFNIISLEASLEEASLRTFQMFSKKRLSFSSKVLKDKVN
jgi:hypothetical protein